MKITVLLFANLREALQESEIEVQIKGGTVQDAIDELGEQYPALKPFLDGGQVQTAVNETYAPKNHALNDGDTLALIPPVSGG